MEARTNSAGLRVEPEGSRDRAHRNADGSLRSFGIEGVESAWSVTPTTAAP
jgi:hypothetical protein